MMTTEIDVVEAMWRSMHARLDDAALYHAQREPCAEGREVLTLLARQSWRVLRQRLALGWPADMDARQAVRVALQLAWHQQRYHEVLSLGTLTQHPRKQQLSRERLHTYALSIAAAAPAYWQPLPHQPPALPHDAGDWI